MAENSLFPLDDEAAAAPPSEAEARAEGKPAAGTRKKPRKKAAGKARNQTPMMEQFWRAKKEAPGALLFFRMGDFYELFHEDAVVASRELGIALTSRSKGDDAIAMAGVPVRSLDSYLIKLVQRGHNVAICEQLQDPREVKGIVERGVVRIVTPGTLTEENALDARRSNFLASVWPAEGRAAVAWTDLSTGRLFGSVVEAGALGDELGRIAPAEVLVPSGKDLGFDPRLLGDQFGARATEREPWRFDRENARRQLLRQLKVASLEGFGVRGVIEGAGGLAFERIECR